MSKIISDINQNVVKTSAAHCREQGVVIPTFHQMRNPEAIPASTRSALTKIGLWDVNPLNLFRITWKNDPANGSFGKVNYLEIPKAITGVDARIVGLVGKYFPTGAHKVGAAFGCLVPRLVSGEFDPRRQKAVWPSTGNFCRGGAFDCALLDCTAVAILPEGMSRERFAWLKEIGAEVIATPGTESNVKEIYDKCWELKKDPNNVIFNQFEEFGNSIWHYSVTGPAIEEVLHSLGTPARAAAFVSATGSAGTIAAGDFLKSKFPSIKVVAAEALQCPTMYMNGFGSHRIEGIGDKHIPWIHNIMNTDCVAAIDDEDCMRILRLFNEQAGKSYLGKNGLRDSEIAQLPLLGISGICNLLSAIKCAKHFGFTKDDVIFTIFTDSAELYQSRLSELEAERGPYASSHPASDHSSCLLQQNVDFFKELNDIERRAIHNLKYFTWVEQQGKTAEELNAQWDGDYWKRIFEDEVPYFDHLIEDFNRLAS